MSSAVCECEWKCMCKCWMWKQPKAELNKHRLPGGENREEVSDRQTHLYCPGASTQAAPPLPAEGTSHNRQGRAVTPPSLKWGFHPQHKLFLEQFRTAQIQMQNMSMLQRVDSPPLQLSAPTQQPRYLGSNLRAGGADSKRRKKQQINSKEHGKEHQQLHYPCHWCV